MEHNQAFCDCGSPVLPNQTRCQVCGKKTADTSRDVESSLDAWKRYVDATAEKEATESELISEFSGSNPGTSKPDATADKGLKKKTTGITWSITYILAIGAALSGVLIYAYMKSPSEFSAIPPMSPTQISSPVQTQPDSVNELSTGDPWDIYIAYYVECAVALANYENTEDMDLICSGGQTIPSFASTDEAKSLIVPTWVENERTRQVVCAAAPFAGTDIIYNDVSGLQEIDKYSELRIEESEGLLVTASLVSPPTLEAATLNHLPDEEYSSVITSLDSDFPFLDATRKLEFETYSEGFCVAHFRVTEMPAFSTALKLYFNEGEIEWTLNPDETYSRNFLIFTGQGQGDNRILDLWDSNNYSDLYESFNH